MRISQNSSAFCGVRCVIARAAENCRSRREAFDERRCPPERNWWKSLLRRAAWKRRSHILSWHQRSSLTTITFARARCVSVADQMQFFADAPLSPNMRKQI